MKVLIGALGTTEYQEAIYAIAPQNPTKYFVYAIAQNERPDKTFILTTNEAYNKHWHALTKEFCNLGESSSLEAICIPLGATQEEAWEIFYKIAGRIPSDSELIVDITTSLRSIPTLLLSAVRYLQYARNVKIQTIYYGAFEAKETKTGTVLVTVPVYTMDSFITLLDWAAAIDTFRRTGNAIPLAERLEAQQNDLALQNTAILTRALRNLSSALDLTLSQTIVVSAHELMTELASVTQIETSSRPLTQPIIELLAGIKEEIRPFAIERPRDDVRKFLRATFALIKWYYERERYTNALQLAREWCITWCMFRNNLPNSDLWLYEKRRNYAKNLKSDTDVGSFWEPMRKLRNRISHTESEEKDFDIDDPPKLEATVTEVKQIIEEVLKLRDKVAAL